MNANFNEYSIDFIKLLIDHGADVNILNNRNRNPLEKLLLETDLSDNIYTITKILISAGIKLKDKLLYKVIQMVKSKDKIYNIVELLLKSGLNPNYLNHPINNTPLHIACAIYESNSNKIYKDLIFLLLTYGGDLTIKDKNGKTPIDYSPKFKKELAKNYLGDLSKLI
jgi:ankyrin repeat protein